MTTPSEAFRSNLRAVRARRGMSQGAMADALDLDRAAYNKLERGGRGVSLDEAVAAAAVLDAPLVPLIFDADETFELATGIVAGATTAAKWATGLQPLGPYPDAYFDALGDGSDRTPTATILWHLLDLVAQLSVAAADDDPAEMGAVLKAMERELDRQREEIAALKRKKARADRKGQS